MEKLVLALFVLPLIGYLFWEGFKGITKHEMTIPIGRVGRSFTRPWENGLNIKAKYMSIYGWFFIIVGVSLGLLVIVYLLSP